ncbi:hypothetical protein OG921_21960 [Aldersonia sp. NBC_00410]|uniref:hypothetical protein n=1 Tax=Aldersonia sp. NBC_00410 TaxID=2975954 RepID=UPI00224D13F4|nr:hypothetical protein [Aldersonia sp. NBC_00410]MCX5045837.1 hypothetical protein [Aldersonia sp. NBC_00410]
MFVRSRFIQRGVVAASALVIAIGLTACGSDDESSDSAATSASATASAAETSAAAAGAPDSAELQSTLDILLDPAKPTTEKTAVVVNGEARTANIEAVTAALANYGKLTFAVGEATVNGDTATAQVQIVSPNGAMPVPMTWQNVDGTWKISDASACQLFAMGQSPCV